MFVTRKALMVAKLEGTAYTIETLANADFNIEVDELQWTEEIKSFQRKVADGTLDTYNSVMGKQTGGCTFMVPLNPGSAVNDEPKWSKFLQACGMKAIGWDGGGEVAVGSAVEGISWVPHTDLTHTPITIECLEVDSGASPSQLVTRLRGCMGNVEFMINEAGEPIQMRFEFQGSLVAIIDRAFGSLPAQTGLSTVQPAAVLDTAVSVGGTTKDIDKFSINLNNSVQAWGSTSVAEGVKGSYIGSRRITLNIDPVAALLANDPVYTRWKAGTTGALSIALSSTPAFTLSAPVAQYATRTRGERNEAVVSEEVFELHKSAATGNDAFEILQGAKS
jgi:hypothetical protein